MPGNQSNSCRGTRLVDPYIRSSAVVRAPGFDRVKRVVERRSLHLFQTFTSSTPVPAPGIQIAILRCIDVMIRDLYCILSYWHGAFEYILSRRKPRTSTALCRSLYRKTVSNCAIPSFRPESRTASLHVAEFALFLEALPEPFDSPADGKR